MRITFEFADHGCPWGGRQPQFEYLTSDGPARLFLVGRDADEEQIRVQLAPASVEADPEN